MNPPVYRLALRNVPAYELLLSARRRSLCPVSHGYSKLISSFG